jgi:hypothetical protein
MIDPESAQFMADAGITLNDSVEEINAKMSEQTKVQERQDVMNELKMEGYEYVPFPGDREDVVSLDVGGKTLSFVAPVEPVKAGSGSGGGGFTSQETRKLEQAGLVGAPRQEQLDFLYGGSGAKVDITPAQERTLVGIGFAGEDIAQIQQDVAEFGLDTVLEGIDNEQQRTAVSEIFGREVKSEPATIDEIKTKITTTLSGIKDVYTRGEAEDLARTNLESALGTKNLPATYENAIQDALVDVYGRTFWQSIIPGGR